MRNAGIQLRVSDLLYAFLKRWKIIISLAVVGFVFGLMLSGMSYVQESSSSFNISGSVIITTKAYGKYLGGSDGPNYYDFHLPSDMFDTIRYILRSDRVMENVLNTQHLVGYRTNALRNNLTVSQYNSTAIMTISLNWYDAEEGIAIWDALVDTTNQVLPDTMQLGYLERINYPTAAVTAASNFNKTMPAFLAIVGFGAGLAYAVIELLMRPTLTNLKDVENVFGLETLGIIPRDNEYFKHRLSVLVQQDKSASVISQNFSAIAYILQNRLGIKEDHHCFYVTSAIEQEGKTTIAAQLGIQLSDMEQRTLLIDFDIKNPSLGSVFLDKVDYSHSLNALYRGEVTIDEALTTLTGYLDLLPMVLEHNAINMDSVIVELIEKLKQRYKYIIIDAPPVGKVSETLSLNQVANTVLFVIGYDTSTIPEIQGSLEKLEKTGVRVLGCIVNAAQTSQSKGIGKEEFKKRSKKSSSKGKLNPFTPPEDSKDEKPIDGLLSNGKKRKKASRKKDSAAKKKNRGETIEEIRPNAVPSGPRNVMEDLLEDSVGKENGESTLWEAFKKMDAENQKKPAPADDSPVGPQ